LVSQSSRRRFRLLAKGPRCLDCRRNHVLVAASRKPNRDALKQVATMAGPPKYVRVIDHPQCSLRQVEQWRGREIHGLS
jgi:hypothetical protein